jgi:hypothetical protein
MPMDIDKLEDRLRGVETVLTKIGTQLEDHFKDADTRSRAHLTCIENCANYRRGFDDRLRALESNISGTSVKVALFWGLFSSIVGGIIIVVATYFLKEHGITK